MAIEIPGTHFVGEVAQKIILEKEGKILLCQDKVDTEAGKWDLPGGRLHKEEKPADGLKREIQEEFGVGIEIVRPLYTGAIEKSFFGDLPRFLVFYEVRLKDPNAKFVLPEDEMVSVRWVGKDEIDDLPIWGVLKDVIKKYFERD